VDDATKKDDDAEVVVSETDSDASENSSLPVRGDGADYVPKYLRDDPNARDFRVEGNDVRDFIGVDPEYMNYADIGGKPLLTDADRLKHTDQYDHLIGNADDDPELLHHSVDEPAEGSDDDEVDENSSPEEIEAALAAKKADDEKEAKAPEASSLGFKK
jgi:hypothetical protein